MKNVRSLLTATALAVVFLYPGLSSGGSVDKSPKSPIQPANDVWTQTLIGGGIKTSDVYTDGNVFLTAPLWSTIGADGILGGDYLFLEPYTSLGEQGELATSLGLSWRHLFSDEPFSALQKQGVAGFLEEGWFVGANVFLDMLDTQHDNTFWQLGFGAEIGSRYLEFRGNYYLPLTDEKQYARDVNTQKFTSQSSRTDYRTVDASADPFAAGNAIYQNAGTRTLATTSTATTTTTVRTVTELYENGMEGWDAEASLLVPWLDQWVDLRVTGGYLNFDNAPFGPADGPTGRVKGWKSGLELRVVPAIVLGGMWYEDERFTGSNWVASAQLQIPLGAGWKDAFKVRRRHTVEHLAEPVHRQNDAVKVGNRKNQDQKTSSKTSVKRVTRVVSQTSNTIVLADDVVFVNNGGPVGNGIQAGSVVGDGTAESPVDTIQSGANIAQSNTNNTDRVWNVYTQGANTYNENVVADFDSVNFIGSGITIPGFGGKHFRTGPAPALTGTLEGQGIGYFGVHGYDVTLSGKTYYGISSFDVDYAELTQNIMRDSGIYVGLISAERYGYAYVADNTITGSGENGIFAEAATYTTQLEAEIANNVISNSANDGITLKASSDSQILGLVYSNTIKGAGATGIYAGAIFENSYVGAYIAANTVEDTTLSGILMQTVDQDSGMSALIGWNIVRNSGEFGISGDFKAGTYLDSFLVAGNDVTVSEYGDGINLAATDVHVDSGFVAIASNIVQNNPSSPDTGATGITVNLTNTDVEGLFIEGNTLLSLYYGIVLNADNSDVSASISGNVMNAIYSQRQSHHLGINVSYTNGATTGFDGLLIAENSITDLDAPNGYPALAVAGTGTGTAIEVEIVDNLLNVSSHGISASANDGARGDFDIHHNTLLHYELSGIGGYFSGAGSTGSLIIEDNYVANGGYGIVGSLYDGGTADFIKILGNTVTNTTSRGMYISASDNTPNAVAVTIADNTITGYGTSGYQPDGILFNVLINGTSPTIDIDEVNSTGNIIGPAPVDGVRVNGRGVIDTITTNTGFSIGDSIESNGSTVVLPGFQP